MRYAEILAATLFACAALPAAAQVSVDGSVDVATDERRRGISWSEGKLAPSASLSLQLPSGFDIGARVTGLRDSPRAGGADAVIDASVGYGMDLGMGFRGDGFVMAHLFTGARGNMDYVEGGVGLSYQLGPAQIGADARYAPSQSAIGGDNLYVSARAQFGLPATPYTFNASIGHSSGSIDDPLRAARLRPGGNYSDWLVGVRRITGPLTLGLDYSGTNIDRTIVSPYADARNSGDRLTARASFSF
ncbi:MAG: TorF family putative porin [Candidatus Sphingomonas colombiensis]|nr:TorF family putative porin [Sphingomonas sp.]WEK41651.1 MAG: TorF family putative porin [Sphingomonas sp.]